MKCWAIFLLGIKSQVEAYFDEQHRLDIARRIIIAAVHNMRANIRYYWKRNRQKELKQTEEKLTLAIEEMTKAQGVNQLMMIEARTRQEYYRSFNHIIRKNGFTFSIRTKRPPKDEMNALISFGNTWLYNRIATELYKASLDIRFGFLHAANRRAESLNLDIAEISKPVIVDRCIFTVINRGEIRRKDHFEEQQEGGTYINQEGKRQIILCKECK